MLRCDNKNTPTPPQAINNDRSLISSQCCKQNPTEFIMGSSVSCRKNNTKLSVQSNAVCISLSSTLFVIGPENSRHSFNQSNLRVKSIALESPAFSRAWRQLHVLALNLSFAQVGHCDYFGFGFMTLKRGVFISALETRWNYISIFKGSASNRWLSNFFLIFQ